MSKTLAQAKTDATLRMESIIENACDAIATRSNTDVALARFAMVKHIESTVKAMVKNETEELAKRVDYRDALAEAHQQVVASNVGSHTTLHSSSSFSLTAKMNKPANRLNTDMFFSRLAQLIGSTKADAMREECSSKSKPSTTLTVVQR